MIVNDKGTLPDSSKPSKSEIQVETYFFLGLREPWVARISLFNKQGGVRNITSLAGRSSEEAEFLLAKEIRALSSQHISILKKEREQKKWEGTRIISLISENQNEEVSSGGCSEEGYEA